MELKLSKIAPSLPARRVLIVPFMELKHITKNQPDAITAMS